MITFITNINIILIQYICCICIFFYIYISNLSKGIGSSWIGLDDKQNEGTYVWQDSTVLQPSEGGWNSGNV